MATVSSSDSEQPKAKGPILHMRQRDQSSNEEPKWQQRRIHLMPKEVEYYGMSSSTTPNGKFPVDRIKVVEKIPEATFQMKYCFQVGDKTEVLYFKAKTDDERTKWMQVFRQIAIDNGNVLSGYYHTGAYDLSSNPPRWSCCMGEKREAIGCKKVVTCSIPLLHGLAMSDTMVFSEKELSDTDETDSVMEQSHESAPAFKRHFLYKMKQTPLDICQIDAYCDDYEPDDPMSHQMVKQSDSGMELPVIHVEKYNLKSDISTDSGFGDGKQGSQANLFAIKVPHSSSQRVRRRSTSSIPQHTKLLPAFSEKGCQTDEDLVNTISNGDIESLRTIIEQGLDPNMDLWVGCHKTTLLSLACEYGQEKIVNAIISEQTELRINCQDEIGKTPLMVAAKKGLTSIVDILIERGADLDLQSSNGRTALHEAAEEGHLEIVHKLLQNEANPLVCAGEHRPYDLAVNRDHREVAEVLQDKMPRKFVPYTLLAKSIHLNSKVGSLRYIGFGKIVASTESEISLIDAELQTVEKIANGSVASLDFWKDTLILGSKCIQFANVKNFKWKLSYEDGKDNILNINHVAVTPNGKMVSSPLRGTTIQIWEPTNMSAYPFQHESSRVTGFSPHHIIEMNRNADAEIYCLSVSMNSNAPYIAVGVKRCHAECEVLIYDYEKNVNQPPNPIINLGKSEHKSVVALAPDGGIVVSGMDHKLEVFSVTINPGKQLQSYSKFGNGTFISSICFPPDGTHDHIAVGLTTGDIKVFSHDLNEGPLFSLQEPNSENMDVMALTYSRDAHFLASGHNNGLVHIWKTPIGRKSSTIIQSQKFVVGSEGGEYASKTDGYGFVIPSDVLSKELTITHGIIPFGKVACHFPEKIVPVSNILRIHPDQKCSSIFMVKISFQHCLNLDLTDPKNLKKIVLLKAHHSDKVDGNSRLHFEVVKDAKIYPSQNLHELIVQVGHCCAYCIGTDITEEDTNLAIRFYLVEIKPKNITESRWNVEYCLSYIFDTCMSELKRQHPNEKYTVTSHAIEFSPTQDGTEPHLELNVTKSDKLGWKVNIVGSRQITKRSLNFWECPKKELVQLQLSKKFPPRIKLEIDGSKARENTSIELSFQGVIAYPGTENLRLKLQLENQTPTLNGLIPKPTASRPDFNEHNTAHLEVLRQHHANLVRMLKSLVEFNTLLLEVYTEKIVDQATYEKFLMKQESNPHCSSTVLGGLLLLDIRKNLEEKPHLFKSFYECVEKVDPDCAKKLKANGQLEEAPADDINPPHGGSTLNFGGEENAGLQSVVKPFQT